ncbi:MAG: cytidine deaminase [Halobacteriovoraceae bacterium]|nr:cytidine deaminase [Halobacteriovoraceae bacterium]
MSLLEQAYAAAANARKQAYAPYSKFLVGAALKAQNIDRLFTGCNVENESYSATVCAERNAVFGMVAILGRKPLEFMVLVADGKNLISPCGMCLQVLNEFASSDFSIHLANLQGIQKKLTLGELLPYPFKF